MEKILCNWLTALTNFNLMSNINFTPCFYRAIFSDFIFLHLDGFSSPKYSSIAVIVGTYLLVSRGTT